ncbi:MAG: hypothetical protein U0992_03480 [Planctomycetaceae bacterium]
MDQEFPILKIWLVLALCFNAARSWNGTVTLTKSFFAQQAASAGPQEADEPTDVTALGIDPAPWMWTIYLAVVALGRIVATISVLRLFQWRWSALWWYCASAVCNLAVAAAGFHWIAVAIDFLLLLALGLILTVIEPRARTELI